MRLKQATALPKSAHAMICLALAVAPCKVSRSKVQEVPMAFVTIDVVPDPGGEQPFKVVFKKGETVMAEWPAESQAAGEKQVMEVLEEVLEDDEEDDK